MLRAIHEQQYDTPTPIQRDAIPAILSGEDVLAAAQTGTGKTAAFALPILQRLGEMAPRNAPSRAVRALVLVPTRELALQVSASFGTYGAYVPISRTTIFGGVGMQPQLDALRKGPQVVVATPGRLLDHVSRKTIDLSQVEILVLDEADRMLDMGFIHDIKRVLALLPRERQNLLFSATFADPIKKLADRLLNRPRRIEVAARNSAAQNVRQAVYRVARNEKTALLADLIHRGGWSQILIFTQTKHGANKLARKLEQADISATAIHGNKSQSARIKALTDFKRGAVRTLVATDIAARGLDIDGLPHVVNFELPNVPEDYVHRIGRTGRAGADGDAVSLIDEEEAPLLKAIEKLLAKRLPMGSEARQNPGTAEVARAKGPNTATPPGSNRRPPRQPATPAELLIASKRSPGSVSRGEHRGAHRSADLAGTRADRHRMIRGDAIMATGSVKWFNPTKGFGFIAPEDHGRDVFIHVSALERAGITGLAEGQRIEYDLGAGRDGRASAENVRLVD